MKNENRLTIGGRSVRAWSVEIGVSERLLWDEIAKGKITPTKVGARRVIITNEAMDEYLKRNTSRRFDASASAQSILKGQKRG